MNEIKCSASMTSLEAPPPTSPQSDGEERQQPKKPWHGERQCGSFNAKRPRRALQDKMWRRSWGSSNDDGQKAWKQSVQELVESNSQEQELQLFLEKYSSICEWLNSVQKERGRFLDVIKLSELARAMVNKCHWKLEINETAKTLSQKYPALKEEFQWRVKHLNSQWNALEKILSNHQQSISVQFGNIDTPGKPCDVNWVRDWLRKMESELQPLNFRTMDWPQEFLEQQVTRYKEIQKEIEEKASAIHTVLRQQQQSQLNEAGRNQEAGKGNTKQSRLEIRWLQLRLRVLEWVQHLSGVAQRQKNSNKGGKRSENLYSATWDSDLDTNEPLRKCPKFDKGGKENNREKIVSNFHAKNGSPSSLVSFTEVETKSNSVDLSSEEEEEEEEQFHELFHAASNPPEQNHQSLQKHSQSSSQQLQNILCEVQGKEFVEEKIFSSNRNSGSVLSATLDPVECDMGQNHDEEENVFSQSKPQVPNSSVELHFDGSHSVGIKRRLSNNSPSPSNYDEVREHTSASSSTSSLTDQQVVPRNISIYYFKHSDTEPEPHRKNQKEGRKYKPFSTSSCSQHGCNCRNLTVGGGAQSATICENLETNFSTDKCNLAGVENDDDGATFVKDCHNSRSSGSVAKNLKSRHNNHLVCQQQQKSRLFLDFDQEFAAEDEEIASVKSYDEISFSSFDLDLGEEEAEEEVAAAPEENHKQRETGSDSATLTSSSQSAAGERKQEGREVGGEEESSLNHLKLSQGGRALQPSHSKMDSEGNFLHPSDQLLCSDSFNNENVCSTQSEMATRGKTSSTSALNNKHKSVVTLNEIEELVQKAELLVQQKARKSRGVIVDDGNGQDDCVGFRVQLESSDDDDKQEDDESALILSQKRHHQHHHNNQNHQQQHNVSHKCSYSHHRNHHQQHCSSQNHQQKIGKVISRTYSCTPDKNDGRNNVCIGNINRNSSITTQLQEMQSVSFSSPPQQKQNLLDNCSTRKFSLSSGLGSSTSFTFNAASVVKSKKNIKSANSTAAVASSFSTSCSSWGTTQERSCGVHSCEFVQQLKCCSHNKNDANERCLMMDIIKKEKQNEFVMAGPPPVSNVVGENGSIAGEEDRHGNVNEATGNMVIGQQQKGNRKNARIRQWIRNSNSDAASAAVKKKDTSSCDASAESASDNEYSSSSHSSISEQPGSSDDPTTVSSTAATQFLQQTHCALLMEQSSAVGVAATAHSSSCCSSSNNISGILPCCASVFSPAGSSGKCSSSSHTIRSPLASSDAGNKTIFKPSCSTSTGEVALRSKKKRAAAFGKERPKSFSDPRDATAAPPASQQGLRTCLLAPSRASWLRTSPSYFVSDSAINLLGSQSSSSSSNGDGNGSESSSSAEFTYTPGNINANQITSVDNPSSGHTKKKNSFRLRKRSQKVRRKTLPQEGIKGLSGASGFDFNLTGDFQVKASSLSEVRKSPDEDRDGADENTSSNSPSFPKPNFLISGPISTRQPCFTNKIVASDNGSSLNTEELNGNEQADWDSYQEKYLSEPYSEEPYDPDGTLKLLAFGEDYGQYLDRAESENSSVLSGFEPLDPRKRRTLAHSNRGKMADSDSDREELNYLLKQSSSQLRFIDSVFREVQTENNGEAPAKYAEMEATCGENISSLELIISNCKETENLPFEIDVRSIEGVLEKWHILREKIQQAANIHHIKEEMGDLKSDFSNVHSLFCTCKQFDIRDMESLKDKIQNIEDVLKELPTRKQQLQQLNDASLKTQVFLEDRDAVSIIKQQLNELYVLYEDNLQLGTFLLERLRYLHEAWEQFEQEKMDFEKSVKAGNTRSRLHNAFSSSLSTDSGHGTDFSHDSSIDSDMEYQVRQKKLVSLKEHAKKVKAFLPPGSPVLELLDQTVEEAEKGLTSLKSSSNPEVINLKSIYPKKKPFICSRRNSGQKSPKSTRSHHHHAGATASCSPSVKTLGRKWTVVRRMMFFNVALMGIFLAAAYFLHPKCCEFSNTFCFSFTPHLSHDSLPPI